MLSAVAKTEETCHPTKIGCRSKTGTMNDVTTAWRVYGISRRGITTTASPSSNRTNEMEKEYWNLHFYICFDLIFLCMLVVLIFGFFSKNVAPRISRFSPGHTNYVVDTDTCSASRRAYL